MHRFIPGRRILMGAAILAVVLAATGGCGAQEKVSTASSLPAVTDAPPTTAAPATAAPTTTKARATTTTVRKATVTTRRATTTTHRTTHTTSAPARNCDPAYPDACLHDGIGDYDCAGGSGNGPNYVDGPIQVRSPDPFDLDRDSDGVGCES